MGGREFEQSTGTDSISYDRIIIRPPFIDITGGNIDNDCIYTVQFRLREGTWTPSRKVVHSARTQKTPEMSELDIDRKSLDFLACDFS